MKSWSLTLALLLAVLACHSVGPENRQPPFKLQLLHFSDIDGGRDIINNAMRFSAIVNEFRRQYPHTLMLSSGDNWIQGPEYSVASDDTLAPVLGIPASGRAHVAYLNALGVQATTFGNHEFDLGTDAVASLLLAEQGQGTSWQGARFPYLAANLDFATDTTLAPMLGQDGAESSLLANKIAGSTVIVVAGEEIGVVGATTPTLKEITAPGGITISPAAADDIEALAASIQAAVDQLTEQGINKIILLSHMQQIAIERQLAGLLRDVDIIVAGGSNTLLADNNDHLRAGDLAVDTYPLSYESATHEPLLIVNTDGDYTYVGRLLVTFDPRGILDTNALDDAINGVYATDQETMTELGLSLPAAMPAVQEISDALTAALTARAGNVFGLTEVYLNGNRGAIRSEETNFGDLVAQANLACAQANDPTVAVSIVNSGSIRAPIGSCGVPPGATAAAQLTCMPPAGTPGINHAGEISRLDVETSLRFNNTLTLVTVTGAELKAIIEHGVAASAPGATPGQFPQVAGMRFSFDPTGSPQGVDTSGARPVVATPGSRVRTVVVKDDNGGMEGGKETVVVQDGVVTTAAANQLFRVVTLEYLVNGGDSYPFPQTQIVHLAQAGVTSGNLTFAADGTEQDALAEYLFTHFPADDDTTTPAFAIKDSPAAEDTVIQNLSVTTTDTVAQ